MFTITNADMNKPGFTQCFTKLQNFPDFDGKTARRFSKLVTNLMAHWKGWIKEVDAEAERLGGKQERGQWTFTDAENRISFDKYFETSVKQEVEVNCAQLDFVRDIEPYETKLKLTPLDYEILEPFVVNVPEEE